MIGSKNQASQYKMSASEHFREIYKCLRDGLYSNDKSYKHLCLEIILSHLAHISKKLPDEMYDSTKLYIKELKQEYNPETI